MNRSLVSLRPLNFDQRDIMVEAAGIEPASEDIQQKLSTCISSSLISFRGARRGKAPKNQPQEHFTHQVQGAPGSLSCSSTLLKDRRRELEKRHAYFLGSEWLCFCTYLGPPFYEVDGISTCSFCLTISVESVRPHTQVSIIFTRLRLVNTRGEGRTSEGIRSSQALCQNAEPILSHDFFYLG